MVDYESNVTESTIEMGSKAAKLASSVSVARIVTFVIAGFAFIILARLLGPSGYGVYAVATATAGTIGAVGDFGIGLTLVKLISENITKKRMEKVRSFLVNSFFILLLIDGIFTVITYLLSGLIAQSVLHNIAYTHPIQIASLIVLFAMLWGDSSSVLIALNEGKRLAILASVQVLLQSGLAIGLVLLGYGPSGAVIGLVASELIGFLVVSAYLVKRLGIDLRKNYVSRDTWRELFSFSTPLGLSNIFSGIIGNFSIIFLGLYSTTAILGNYGVTTKISNVFDVFVNSIGLAMLPIFSAALASNSSTKNIGKYYNYSIYTALLFLVPAVFYILVLSTPFTYTLLGAVYTTAPLYVSVMSVGIILYVISGYTTNLMVGDGKVKSILKYNVITAVFSLALLLVLVPTLNALGLVLITFVLSPLASSFLLVRKVQDTMKLKLDLKKAAQVVVSGAVSAAFIIPISFFFNNSGIPLLIIAAVEQVLLYPIILVFFRAVKAKDLETLRKVTVKLPVVGELMRLATGYTGMFLR